MKFTDKELQKDLKAIEEFYANLREEYIKTLEAKRPSNLLK